MTERSSTSKSELFQDKKSIYGLYRHLPGYYDDDTVEKKSAFFGIPLNEME